VQHALRAHTPDDERLLAATARTYPKAPYLDLEEVLTSLGIGEAVVTVLDPRGVPTPVMPTRLIPPASRMAPLTPDELQADIRQSDLVKAYGTPIDRESAREILAARLAKTAPEAPAPEAKPDGEGWKVGRGGGRGSGSRSAGYYHRENGGEGTGTRCLWYAGRPCAPNDETDPVVESGTVDGDTYFSRLSRLPSPVYFLADHLLLQHLLGKPVHQKGDDKEVE
jgi:hypothetical protein